MNDTGSDAIYMISKKSKKLEEACYVAKDIVDLFRIFAECEELNTTPIGKIKQNLKNQGMEILETFFNLIFAWRENKIKDILKSFCSFKGYALNEEMCCYFSPEWKDYGLEYFGENKVLFDFQAHAVDEDKQIVISYQEFYAIVCKYYFEYARQHSEEQDEIMRLHAELKNKLNVKQ